MTEALPSMRFAQKNVLVTGAAAGLGRHLAQAFAAEGADIAILDFQDARATAREITALRRRCESFRSDVRDEDGVKKSVAGAAEFFDGRIDVLVNNAGFKRTLQPDQRYAACALARDDRDQSHRDDAGHAHGPAVHARSQVGRDRHHGVERGPSRAALSRRLCLLEMGDPRLHPDARSRSCVPDIRVNAVCPGPIEGDRIEDVMGRHAEVEGKSIAEVRREWEATPMNRFVEPQEVASVMLFLCSSEASAMTGQAINVTGGFIMT